MLVPWGRCCFCPGGLESMWRGQGDGGRGEGGVQLTHQQLGGFQLHVYTHVHFSRDVTRGYALFLETAASNTLISVATVPR